MIDRRSLLTAGLAGAGLFPAIARARAIDADVRTGTIKDVAHVVVFMQENRSFDHYFGAMAGVRGFGDRFPIPVPDVGERKSASVWVQANSPKAKGPALIAPFALNTRQTFAHMRVEGTPHLWPNAQDAWNEGRMDRWPAFKTEHSMGHYDQGDIPFQYALADAFTVCDAYHCSIQAGTNPNRIFLWTGGTNPSGELGGPVMANTHDRLPKEGGSPDSYRWTTYVERLQAAGVTWRNYQDMADNFTDNPLAGFQSFRDAHAGAPGSNPDLAARGMTTHKLDQLKADVLAGDLPQISFVIAPAAASEHPGPSSPAQGADYTAQVIDALTADPKVWAKTVLLVMFDENDGFFDHMPPPSPPSLGADGVLLGGSTVDLTGEHHSVRSRPEVGAERADLMGRPYGLGPRVPMYVISPWSRGGYVNSQVFDHTSVIRFLEARFGVAEPNITPWRREVCGDLTSAFNFAAPNRAGQTPKLPSTVEAAAKAKALAKTTRPPTPLTITAPVQAHGTKPSRALPYELAADLQQAAEGLRLTFTNTGNAAAVFQVYDKRNLTAVPRRYTVSAGKSLTGDWALTDSSYDLWVLGPNGFHRRFEGGAKSGLALVTTYDSAAGKLTLTVSNPTTEILSLVTASPNYGAAVKPWRASLAPGETKSQTWTLSRLGGWYDLALISPERPDWRRRLAGRLETGRDSISDPALGGAAVLAV